MIATMANTFSSSPEIASSPVGEPKRKVDTWPRLRALSSFFAEAAVAEVVHRSDSDARWIGGTNRAWDVKGADLLVDAKTAFIQTQNADDGPEPCLSFMGSLKRTMEARDGITYGLVLLHFKDGHDGPSTSHATQVVRLDTEVGFTVFRFEPDEINDLFVRPYIKDRSRRRVGGNLHLPMRIANSAKYFWGGVPVDENGIPTQPF